MSEAMIVDVTLNNIQEMVMQNSERLPVICSFWSPMDEDSRAANVILEKLANKHAGKFILAKINSDQQKELAEKFNLPGIPFFKLIRNREIITEQQGLFTEEEYTKLLDTQIEKDPSEELRQQASAAFAREEYDQAILLLAEAAKTNPNNYHVHLDLVTMYLHTGHLDKAQDLFEKLPEEAQQDPLGKEISGVLFFSAAIENSDDIQEIDRTLKEDDFNCDALYGLAAYLMVNGQAHNALETLFRLFTIDRNYQDGLPQKAILKAFDMLGHQAPEMVVEYRRKFQNMLY